MNGDAVGTIIVLEHSHHLEASHALGTAELDDHHADPIDRLLVGQSMLEKICIVGTDPSLGEYGIEVIDATT